MTRVSIAGEHIMVIINSFQLTCLSRINGYEIRELLNRRSLVLITLAESSTCHTSATSVLVRNSVGIKCMMKTNDNERKDTMILE